MTMVMTLLTVVVIAVDGHGGSSGCGHDGSSGCGHDNCDENNMTMVMVMLVISLKYFKIT